MGVTSRFEKQEAAGQYSYRHIGFIRIDGTPYVYDLKTFEIVGLDNKEIAQAARAFLQGEAHDD